ncbi:MAG: MATE family efflux transporter [Bacteroidia bacterium]|nr:MATE family efflux transporter [Bacteroidia bacterium]
MRNRLFHLTWPIFVEISLTMLLGIGDIFMLGSYSDYAVGAVGVVNQLMNMVFLLFGVVTTGTSVLCSRYLGMRQHNTVKEIIGVSLFFNLVFSCLMSGILTIFAPNIIDIMGLRPELREYAIDYMRIVGGFAWVQALSLTVSAILRSLQRPKFPMVAIMIVNVVNIIGNYMLIFGHGPFPELGVEGAAISTVFSRIVSFSIVIICLKKIVVPDLGLKDIFPFRWNKLKEILNIGLPGAGEMLSYDLSQVTVTYFINLISNEALIARTYVVNIALISYLFTFAVAQSCTIMVGYSVGEGHINAGHKLCLYCSKRAIQVSVTIGIILASTCPWFIEIFTDNPEVITMVSIALWIDIILGIGRALNMIVIGALRAAGDYVFPVAFGAISVWGIATGMSWVLGIYYGLGLAGVWIAFASDENVRGWIMLHRWNRKFREGTLRIKK